MFLLWKNILWLPIAFLCQIGQPFKFDVGSSLRQQSEKDIKQEYNKKKFEHYFGRVLMSAAFIVGCLLFLILVWLTDGIVLLLFPVVTVIVVLIDAFMALARFVHHQETVKSAEARNELVVINDWKDTSLNGLLRKRNEEIKKFKEEYMSRTGEEPTEHEVQYR